MNFTEYEQKLLDTKPRFLSDVEKVIRLKCKNKIKYNKNKEYHKNYREDKKEKIKKYTEDNKDKNKEYKKEYYQENKEELLEYKKEYLKTPEGKKNNTKASWKCMGLNMENFEEVYKRYCKTTNCENCGVLLTKKGKNNTFKCMDHDHSTGEFRNILCHLCNRRRG